MSDDDEDDDEDVDEAEEDRGALALDDDGCKEEEFTTGRG